jgi:putative hydrolase of HD superfamily
VLGGARRENSAEHSWHVAMCALVLAPNAPPGVSVDRAVRMLLVHDIVEIDAGDVPIHAEGDRAAQAERERAAADRLFAMVEQGPALRSLWDEFEAGESPDARFARAVVRVQPVLLNLAAGGRLPDRLRRDAGAAGRAGGTPCRARAARPLAADPRAPRSVVRRPRARRRRNRSGRLTSRT